MKRIILFLLMGFFNTSCNLDFKVSVRCNIDKDLHKVVSSILLNGRKIQCSCGNDAIALTIIYGIVYSHCFNCYFNHISQEERKTHEK